MKKSTISRFIITTCFLFPLIFVAVFQFGTNIAHAQENESKLYSKMTDGIVELYENDIAHSKVVTKYAESTLEALAQKHGFSLKKYKTMLILADFSTRVNNPKSFDELAQMSDNQILRFGKKCIDDYAKTLSKEEKKTLKNKALDALREH